MIYYHIAYMYIDSVLSGLIQLQINILMRVIDELDGRVVDLLLKLTFPSLF